MKIYLASSFVSQKRLRPIRDRLWSLGNEVISSWLDEVALPEGMSKDIFDKQLAIKDLMEVRSADCLILDTMDQSTTGGRYVEWGLALGQAKLKYLVGPRGNIFEQLADMHFNTWDECFAYFEANHKAEKYVATGMTGKDFT